MRLLLACLMFLAVPIEAQDIPANCLLHHFGVRATKVAQGSCSPYGTMAFRITYRTVTGRRIDPLACGIDQPTWGSHGPIELSPTGMAAWVRDILPGEQVFLYVAVTQGDNAVVLERYFKY